MYIELCKNKIDVGRKAAKELLKKIEASGNKANNIALPYGSDADNFLHHFFKQKKVFLNSKFFQSEELICLAENKVGVLNGQIRKNLNATEAKVKYITAKNQSMTTYRSFMKKINFDFVVAGVNSQGTILGIKKLKIKNQIECNSLLNICGKDWKNILKSTLPTVKKLPTHFVSLGSKAGLYSHTLFLLLGNKNASEILSNIDAGKNVVSEIVQFRERHGLETKIFIYKGDA